MMDDMYIMSSRAIQVSIDRELLRRMDADPEVKRLGRSAFLRNAVQLYLRARDRQAIDRSIREAYAGQADAMLDEIADLMGGQAWPKT
jgi:metal-responsive CopG/Arc/MetJ family transcriptional regulator